MTQTTVETPPPAPPFFQRPLVQQVVPLLTSFAFHVTIIVIASLLIVPLLTGTPRKAIEQVIIPDTTLVQGANAGGVPNPGINDDPSRAARQDAERGASQSAEWAQKKSDTLVANLTQGAADSKQNITPIGVGQTSSASVTGLTERGQSTGGSLAPFGPAGGGGGQGKGLFGLPGGNVRRVVYVCDASGTMVGVKQALLNLELNRAIGSLRLSQSFNVIFFKDAQSFPMNPGSLLLASDKNKKLAATFIERTDARLSSDPIPALKDAFAMQPELVFLLSDGALDEPEKVFAELGAMNVGKRVHVNTIMFLPDRRRAAINESPETTQRMADEEDTQAKIAGDTLKQIADAHGGTYKLVRPIDLQR